MTDEPEAEGGAQEGQSEAASGERRYENLDDDPRFRKHKSQMDKQIAALRSELEQTQAQAQEYQRQLEAERVSEQPPEEQAAYYEARVMELEEEMNKRERRQQQQMELQQRARTLLEKHGISWDDPRLDLSADVTERGLAQLTESVNDILAERLREATQSKRPEETKRKREKAKEQVETNEVKTSTAKGGETPEARQRFVKLYKRYRGSGRMRAYTKMKRRFEAEHGADVVAEWLRTVS